MLEAECFGVFCAQLRLASSMDKVEQHWTKPDHLKDEIEYVSASQPQTSQLWND